MTEEKIAEHKRAIDKLTHSEMAQLWRFAQSGHPYFDNRFPLFEYFKARFDKLGGMNTGVSKAIGW